MSDGNTRKKLVIVTDAWEPQTNGVVSSIKQIQTYLPSHVELTIIHPGLGPTVKSPYPDLRFSINPWKVVRRMRGIKPDFIHISTEGPLGLAAKRLCKKLRWKYTTAMHTKFAEYMNIFYGVPVSLGYKYLKWYHRGSSGIIVRTDEQKHELERMGFNHLCVLPGGVDIDRFKFSYKSHRPSVSRLLYVGRVSKEKSLDDFLSINTPHNKVVVGGGPDLERLRTSYPGVSFLGFLSGADLVSQYQQADLFVFPSRSDTFGLVMIESLACGTPVLAYDVMGAREILTTECGILAKGRLEDEIESGLKLGRLACRERAEEFTMQKTVDRFLGYQVQNDY